MALSSLPQVTARGDKLDILSRLYRHMFTAVEVDRLEQQYTRSGEAFFHVAGRGHEAIAALEPHLLPADWLSCHYRSKALMLARGLSLDKLFASFFAKDASHSRGRQMSAHLSSPEHHITSLVGPVGNNALNAVGIAEQIATQGSHPISVCCLGEGTTQQGEVLEALQEASRRRVPVLFVIEDNQWAISTPTAGRTFYSLSGRDAEEYCGLPIHYLDGRDAAACLERFGEIVQRMRFHRSTEIVVLRTRRLSDHTNADDQMVYRPAADIQQEQENYCPVAGLERELVSRGMADTLEQIKRTVAATVAEAAERALAGADPQPTTVAAPRLPEHLRDIQEEYLGTDAEPRLTMIEALREVLAQRLADDPRVHLYGQDIEDPKGDVFGLTRGLSSRFPGRVENAPLSESTIVGTAVGRAIAGGRPVAMLQFADFLPLAFNQICSEISTLYWRSDGGWQCPVLIMAPCGGYRPGLGHFHAQSFESIAAHLPGIDVLLPSRAADAAGLLNAAFESARPTLFFYPKACLNDRQRTTSADTGRQLAAIGRARTLRYGGDLTLVAWGNTVERALAAADLLAEAGKRCEIIDLRSIAPWDRDAVIRSAEKTRHLLVVHEDGHTCGMGGEILATVAEAAAVPITMRRLTRPDVPIPCNFANQLEILPSIRRTVEAAADLLGLDLEWDAPVVSVGNLAVIEAIGASPSDESVTITTWHVKAGDEIAKGDLLVEYEADKAVTELLSPYRGQVEDVLVAEGEGARVGAPLLRLRVDDPGFSRAKPVTREILTTPRFRPRRPTGAGAGAAAGASADLAQRTRPVGLQRISGLCGSQRLDNEAVLGGALAGRDPADILRTTGIAQRPRIGDDETAAGLAAAACQQLLQAENLHLGDIDTLICATGTPGAITPSTACQIMALVDPRAECAAYDVNAACSGYLYALQNAYDMLQQKPGARILVVTTEVLSPLLDETDYTTAILFGDAATASLLCGEQHIADSGYRLQRPSLSGQADAAGILTVPHRASGETIRMDGGRVFSTGVRKMTESLRRALDESGRALEDIELVVPHQANQRIMNAIVRRLGLPPERFFSNIRHHGNTSSNSIPLALIEVLAQAQPPRSLALTAFGGGFTYGACLLDRVDPVEG